MGILNGYLGPIVEVQVKLNHRKNTNGRFFSEQYCHPQLRWPSIKWKSPLDAALFYARDGMKIFPCRYVKVEKGKLLPEEDWKKPPLDRMARPERLLMWSR